MISQNDIMKIVKDYAKSPAGKKAIKDTYGIEYDEKFNKNKAMVYAKKMKDILFKHVNSVIKSIAADDIRIGELCVNDEGRLYISIFFDPNCLQRESLRYDLYPEGISNIVLLFERGYHANGAVHGEWHGVHTWSLTDREPNSFLKDAVQEFNSRNSKVATASLEGVYE